jgi:hypothetical protein
MSGGLTQQQRSDAFDAAVQPLPATAAGFRLTASASSVATSANVVAGQYVVRVKCDTLGVDCWLCWGDTAVIPASAAAGTAGTMSVDNGETVTAPGSTKVSVILTATANAQVSFVPLVAGAP